MKRFAVLILAVFVAPVCLLAATYTVTVAPAGSFTFDPPSQTINVGDTVTWVWGLNSHSTTSGAPCLADDRWNSGILSSPNSFSVTFPAAGTFSYFCELHCVFGMTGQIIVQAVTDTPTPTPTPPPAGTPTAPPTPGSLTPTNTPAGVATNTPTTTPAVISPAPTQPGGVIVPVLSPSMLGLLAFALVAAALFVMRRS